MLHVCDRSKTCPMVRRGAILAQRREMMRRAIAHIGLPAKTGIVARDADHETVAMLFREDARRRNTRMQRIAADDRGRGVAPFGKAIAIDEYPVRAEAQRLTRARQIGKASG